jgi:hypothetical protein
MVFFDHQNKCWHARHVEVSSLLMRDSSFNYVPRMLSPTVPKLDRMHQKTITMHSHGKRGDVVWRQGMYLLFWT